MGVVDTVLQTYRQARSQFLAQVRALGGRATSCQAPDCDLDGEPLFIDMARFGADGAKKRLITVSGVHGLEGAGGALAQRAGLARLPDLDPEGQLSITFIHAANPWGWAHGRRATRENVDLNRNFWTVEPRPNLHFDDLFPDLPKDDLADAYFEEVERRGAALAARCGEAAFMDAMSGGQFHRQEGWLFGGFGPTWENATLRRLIAAAADGAEIVTFIDWHTGIGAFAEPHFLCFNEPKSAEFKLAAALWGEEVSRDAAGFDDLPRPRYEGLLFDAVVQEARPARVVGGVIEFGTYAYAEVTRALIADAWLHGASPSAPAISRWRAYTAERFFPDSEAWRRAVAQKGGDIFARTVTGMLGW